MKKRLFSLLVSALVFTLSGCREKSLLRESDPVTLNFWHVYGEQSGSPMDLLVQEFNRTVGQEKGVRVQVTNLSSASKIGGFLKEAQKGGRDAPEMPDLFTCHISDATALGSDNLVDWNAWFTAEELSNFVPGFLADGMTEDGTPAALPYFQIHPASDVQRQRLRPLFSGHRRQLRRPFHMGGLLRCCRKVL